MPGFSSVTGLESIMFADNCSFDGTKRGGAITTDGQLWIGNTNTPRVRVGSLTSPNGTLTIGYSAPNITLDVNGGAVGQTITGNTGGPLSPTAGNWNILGTNTNGIQCDGAMSTLTVRMNSPFADSDFSFESQTGGEVRTLTVQNTVDAADSAAVLQVGIDGSSSDYSMIRLFENTNNSWGLGITGANPNHVVLTYDSNGNVTPTTFSNLPWRAGVNGGIGEVVVRSQMAVASEGEKSGGNVFLNVQNGEVAANSNATVNIQVSAANGGNATVSWTGPANNWYLGVDKGDGNNMKLQQGVITAFPTANNIMQATPDGEVTFPLTPCFAAFLPATDANATGNGTLFTIGTGNAWSEIFDQNNDFNTNGTFTAPVNGRYLFALEVGLNNVGAGHTAALLQLTTSNRGWRPINAFNPANMRASDNQGGVGGSMVADMDAGDTAILQIQINNSTQTVGIAGNNAGVAVTYITGKLIA